MSFDININTINKVLERRTSIMEQTGPPEINPFTIYEYLDSMLLLLKNAHQQAEYGEDDRSIDGLIHVLATGMICLDQHLEADEGLVGRANIDEVCEKEEQDFSKLNSRKVTLLSTVTFKKKAYKVASDLNQHGKKIQVFNRPEEDGSLLAIIDGKPIHLHEVDADFPLSDHSNKDMETLPMDALVLIARYEMYAALEMYGKGPLTDAFVPQVPEDKQALLDRYMNAKMIALCGEAGNATLMTDNKNADAVAAKHSAPANDQ